MKLTEHVMGLLRGRGWQVNNADVTIIAQKPKLAPTYRRCAPPWRACCR